MDKIKQIIKEYEELSFDGLARRYDARVLALDSALTIVGPRRAGKTTFLRQLIHEQQLQHFLFLNFEDERLMTFDDMDIFIEAFIELYGEKPVIFLDEVQNLKNWHQKVRRLIDQQYRLTITGSNANLLSNEIATHLAGRTFIQRMLPFTFQEYLSLKQMAITDDALYGKGRFQTKKLFQDFLQHGGFPEVAKTTMKKDVLQQYYEIVFYRDLIVRHGIRQETALRLLIQKLVENIGKSYNVTNLKNRLSQIIKISKQTVFDYLRFLSECYFVIHIKNYQKSFLQRETERKSYFIDTGFLNILSLETDPARLFENLVFLEYYKAGYELFYFKERYECDFVVLSDGHIKELVQVCYNLNDHNEERELKGLQEAMTSLNVDMGMILTNSREDTKNVDGLKVRILPVWKWLLSNIE